MERGECAAAPLATVQIHILSFPGRMKVCTGLSRDYLNLDPLLVLSKSTERGPRQHLSRRTFAQFRCSVA